VTDGTVSAVPESTAYLAGLTAALVDEFRTEGFAVPSGLLAAEDGESGFASVFAQYRAAAAQLAGMLDASFEPAAAYRTMEEFWADATQQEQGLSPRTYWDSYENGRRRRTERLAATAFGSEQAVLVNAGMSALDVAIRSSGIRPGDTLLVHDRMYFETRDLLDALYEPWGFRIVEVDLRDPDAVTAAVARHEPVLALAELALNGTRCDVPVLEPLQAAGIRTILDSSALGHGVVPAELMAGPTTLYVESGMKYLSRAAGSGVIYGWGEWGQAARLCARRTGQQLQGRALHWLRPGEVAACRSRLALHSARRLRFVATLERCWPDLVITDARRTVAGRQDMMAAAVSRGADGCMAFVRLPDIGSADRELAHRAVVAEWAAAWDEPRVRAGFGWTLTSGRAYGRDALNTGLGESFTRFSVGIEPQEQIDDLAEHLAETARKAVR
jgi:cystathionine beta-lyase/cystathionine gamma-synthase